MKCWCITINMIHFHVIASNILDAIDLAILQYVKPFADTPEIEPDQAMKLLTEARLMYKIDAISRRKGA